MCPCGALRTVIWPTYLIPARFLPQAERLCHRLLTTPTILNALLFTAAPATRTSGAATWASVSASCGNIHSNHADAFCCTLLRYILRRYLGGEDKEEASKVHRVLTADEWEKIRKQVRRVWGIVGKGKQRRLPDGGTVALPQDL